MDFQVFDLIPIPVICFESILADDDKDIKISRCNNAFVKIFNGDFSGMKTNEISGEIKNLFEAVRENFYNGNKSFSCFFENKNMTVTTFECENFHICAFNVLSNVCCDERSAALDEVSSGVIIADCDNKIEFINSKAKALLEIKDSDLGYKIDSVFALTPVESYVPSFEKKLVTQMLCDCEKRFYLHNKNGTVIPVTAKLLRSDDKKNIIIINDITQKIKYLHDIDFLKDHDLLTGLYNRTYFENVIPEIDNKSNFPLSIIIGDINGLRMINDILGKKRGDEVLLRVANIFTLASRDSDIVARYGGDTFIVVLLNTDPQMAQKICKNILSLCKTESSDDSKISVSLGYSCKTNQNQSINEVMNSAENYMMKNKMLEVKSYRNSFLASLKGMMYDKSYETEKHALRLTSLCRKIGSEMGLSEGQLNDLGLFSMLHDIGKIGINSKVLSKPGKLTEDEWVEMRKHSYIGYRIAKAAPELEGIANNILYHHERFDGKGYPDGLIGEEIPLLSRILSVADSYDAMVNDRCYRKAMPKAKAIAEIKRCSGTQFDPNVVKHFLKIIDISKSDEN